MINPKYKGELALLANTILWGGTFTIVKTSLDNVSPMIFLGFRFLIAALILIPFVYKILKTEFSIKQFQPILLGIIFFLAFASQTAGLQFTSATKSGFITGTFVVFTPIFQMILEKRIPRKGNIIGIFFVIAGMLFLFSPGNSFAGIITEIGSDFNLGDFLTLLCAILFSIHIVYLDMISKKYNSMMLVFVQIIVTAILAFFFALIFNLIELENIRLNINNDLIFGMIYTAIFATILTVYLQTKFQHYVSPTKASILFSFEPIFAALFAFFLLNEKISNFGYAGCILIFTGLLISELLDKKKN